MRLDQREVTLMWHWLQYLDPVLDEAAELITNISIGPDDIGIIEVVYTLDKRALVEKHPSAIAKLLIYLGKQSREAGVLVSARDVVARLQDLQLPPEMAEGVRELDSRIS